MSKKKPVVLQAPLFNLDSPPVKLPPMQSGSPGGLIEEAKPPSSPLPQPETQEPPEVRLFPQEINFYLKLFKHLDKIPDKVFICPYCGRQYRCISFHLLKVCTGQWEAPAQEQILIVEKDSEVNNLCAEYPYKTKGLPDADKMHPSQWAKPIEPTEKKVGEGPPLKVEAAPHFWHWTRSTDKMKAQEPYTPGLTARRRSIPAIACSLYYSVELAVLSMLALSTSQPQYYAVNKIFYDVDKKKVERYIKLLVFCGLDEERVRWWVREAWTAAKEGPLHPWPDTKKGGEVIKQGAGPGLLGLLGYQLEEKEPDGFGDTNLASFGEFLQEEGVTGR